MLEEKTEESQPVVEPEQKKWKNLNNLVKHLGGLIIQKYEEKPSLVNNRKYDLRYYMLIACTKPYLVLTNTGYARISLEEYQTANYGSDTKEDRACHMTNASIQKYHPKFKEEKESTILSMDQLRDHMIAAKGITAETFNTNVISKCDEICRLVFETCKDKLE